MVSVGGRLVVGNGEAELFRRASVVGYGGRRPEGKKKHRSLSLLLLEMIPAVRSWIDGRD
jgi:hypothetical protein